MKFLFCRRFCGNRCTKNCKLIETLALIISLIKCKDVDHRRSNKMVADVQKVYVTIRDKLLRVLLIQ